MSIWNILQQDPVISPAMLHEPFDSSRAGACHVIQLGDKYRMIYWGSDGQGCHHILQAETPATSPNQWKPIDGPLLGPQPETDYNCQGPAFPFLLPLTQDRWLLYFTAWGRRADGKLPNTTGVAVSDDGGKSWQYHPEHPVIPLDRAYDAEGTGSLWIVQEGSLLRMYYTAIGTYYSAPQGVQTGHGERIPKIGIAYAESTDGIRWEKPLDDLVVAPRGFGVEPYEYICSKPCVIRQDDGYVMWVNTFGTAYRVHRLFSSDGVQWEWGERCGPDGELGVGDAGAFDDRQRSYPNIVADKDVLHCWFTGNQFGATGMGYASGQLK